MALRTDLTQNYTLSGAPIVAWTDSHGRVQFHNVSVDDLAHPQVIDFTIETGYKAGIEVPVQLYSAVQDLHVHTQPALLYLANSTHTVEENRLPLWVGINPGVRTVPDVAVCSKPPVPDRHVQVKAVPIVNAYRFSRWGADQHKTVRDLDTTSVIVTPVLSVPSSVTGADGCAVFSKLRFLDGSNSLYVLEFAVDGVTAVSQPTDLVNPHLPDFTPMVGAFSPCCFLCVWFFGGVLTPIPVSVCLCVCVSVSVSMSVCFL